MHSQRVKFMSLELSVEDDKIFKFTALPTESLETLANILSYCTYFSILLLSHCWYTTSYHKTGYIKLPLLLCYGALLKRTNILLVV